MATLKTITTKIATSHFDVGMRKFGDEATLLLSASDKNRVLTYVGISHNIDKIDNFTSEVSVFHIYAVPEKEYIEPFKPSANGSYSKYIPLFRRSNNMFLTGISDAQVVQMRYDQLDYASVVQLILPANHAIVGTRFSHKSGAGEGSRIVTNLTMSYLE
jgi:hypothetical protein